MTEQEAQMLGEALAYGTLTVIVALIMGFIVNLIVGLFIDGWRGALWALFLGPIGWVIASLRRSSRIQSRQMAELINKG